MLGREWGPVLELVRAQEQAPARGQELAQGLGAVQEQEQEQEQGRDPAMQRAGVLLRLPMRAAAPG